MPESVPHIDFSQITFPTDQFTVRDIRQEWYRESISSPASTLLKGLEDLIETERELAERAFFAALGQLIPPHVTGIGGAEGARAALAAEYEHRGIASGEHTAEQLVRAVEAQAAAQAAHFLGRPLG